MNLDFHYYGTYLAARMADYSAQEARVIAYAAQYVDESSKSMIVKEPSGLEQIPTVQSDSELRDYMLNPLPFTKKDLSYIRRTWMSFHFLPGNFEKKIKYQGPTRDTTWVFDAKEEQNFRLLCLSNSSLVEKMINAVRMNHRDKHYLLEMAGLSMHVLADSWAHSYYAGKPAWYMNDAKDDVKEYDNSAWYHLIFVYDFLFNDNVSLRKYSCTPIAPRYNGISYLGHGRMGHIPDYGFMTYVYHPIWKYNAPDKNLTKNNQEWFYNAFTQMVYALKCIRSNKIFAPGNYDPLVSEDIRAKVKQVFKNRVIDQSSDWIRCIKAIYNEELPKFDKNIWKNEFERSGKSKNTNYYRFALSANYHKNLVEDYLIENGSNLLEMDVNEEYIKPFDDAQLFGSRNCVSKICGSEGWIVDCLKFVYDDNYETNNHGNPRGGSKRELKLEPGEIITKIEGDMIDYQGAYDKPIVALGKITFTTSRGKKITLGGGNGKLVRQFSYQAPTGKQIFALKGKIATRYLQSGQTISYIVSIDLPLIK